MKKYTILVVDDTPKNLQILGKILNSEGYLIAAATEGEKSIGIAEKILPDLILLDIRMPGMDGFEVLKKLKSSSVTQEIPVIFLTASSEREDIVSGFGLGASDYITKPFKPEELIARIKMHIMLNEAVHEKINNEKLEAVIETAGAACHELNQPLQSLMLYCEMLKLKNPEDENARRKLDNILVQVDRLAVITRQLNNITTYKTKEYIEGKNIIDLNGASTS